MADMLGHGARVLKIYVLWGDLDVQQRGFNVCVTHQLHKRWQTDAGDRPASLQPRIVESTFEAVSEQCAQRLTVAQAFNQSGMVRRLVQTGADWSSTKKAGTRFLQQSDVWAPIHPQSGTVHRRESSTGKNC